MYNPELSSWGWQPWFGGSVKRYVIYSCFFFWRCWPAVHLLYLWLRFTIDLSFLRLGERVRQVWLIFSFLHLLYDIYPAATQKPFGSVFRRPTGVWVKLPLSQQNYILLFWPTYNPGSYPPPTICNLGLLLCSSLLFFIYCKRFVTLFFVGGYWRHLLFVFNFDHPTDPRLIDRSGMYLSFVAVFFWLGSSSLPRVKLNRLAFECFSQVYNNFFFGVSVEVEYFNCNFLSCLNFFFSWRLDVVEGKEVGEIPWVIGGISMWLTDSFLIWFQLFLWRRTPIRSYLFSLSFHFCTDWPHPTTDFLEFHLIMCGVGVSVQTNPKPWWYPSGVSQLFLSVSQTWSFLAVYILERKRLEYYSIPVWIAVRLLCFPSPWLSVFILFFFTPIHLRKTSYSQPAGHFHVSFSFCLYFSSLFIIIWLREELSIKPTTLRIGSVKTSTFTTANTSVTCGG